MSKRLLVIVCLPALILVGCGNPADDKPKAEVGAASLGDTPAATGIAYIFSDESTIDFVGSKITGSHNGGFKTFEGSFNLVDNDPGRSSVEITINTTSLWADNDKLTGHLKSPDFFDVAAHPIVHFKSTSILSGDDGYTVSGNLQLHGVTKSITFPASIDLKDNRLMIKSEFSINRFDFAIEYKGNADNLIRNEVVIKLDIVAVPGNAS